MARRFTKRQLGAEDIPVASFSDVAFLLIIFFILTTTFQKPSGFLADIPSGEKGEVKQEETTTVALYEDKITLNDKNVSTSELRQYLQGLRLDQKTGEEKMVLLTAAGKVKYQNYFKTMAIITSAGGAVAIMREEDTKETKRE